MSIEQQSSDELESKEQKRRDLNARNFSYISFKESVQQWNQFNRIPFIHEFRERWWKNPNEVTFAEIERYANMRHRFVAEGLYKDKLYLSLNAKVDGKTISPNKKAGLMQKLSKYMQEKLSED